MSNLPKITQLSKWNLGPGSLAPESKLLATTYTMLERFYGVGGTVFYTRNGVLRFYSLKIPTMEYEGREKIAAEKDGR